MKPRSSNLTILYRGRCIKRFWSAPFGSQYVVMWADGGRERCFYTGSLADLLAEIKDTDKFFGKWRFLI